MSGRQQASLLGLDAGPIEYEELPAQPGAEDLASLVLLHEGLGSRQLWRRFPRDVAAASGRRTLTYSRHGYGRSAVVTEPRAVDYLHREAIDVLPQVLDRLGYVDPVLIGHSDGASIALIHAGAAAGSPTALVLLAPHVIVEDRSIAGIEAARETYRSTDMGERMGRYHDDPTATFWGWNDIWLAPAFRDWDIRALLPGVRCPVLSIQGVDDEYGTLRQLDLVEEGVPGPVQRVEVPDCGHAPHLEQPEATTHAVVTFLAALGR